MLAQGGQGFECESGLSRLPVWGFMSPAKELRHRFYKALWLAMKVVSPVFSVLLGLVLILGFVIGWIEGWHPFEGIYFAFVTGLTVGYGDLVPKQTLSRVLAIAIGFHGVLLTALFAAISVRALQESMHERPAEKSGLKQGN